MTRPTLDVTFGPEDAARVPDCLLEGVAVLASLLGQEVLEDVGEKVQIRRQGGFCGLDVWLFLWLYFSSGLTCGLRKFWKVLGPVSRLVGPVMGRKKLPSPASVSRALDSVEHELLRPRASWLLAGVAGIDELLGHPVVQSYDANGEGWHVFDVDPTVTTLRHRALPSGEDLPAPRRRSEHTGAPGYSGRKRATSRSAGSPRSTQAPGLGFTPTLQLATATGWSTWNALWTPSRRLSTESDIPGLGSWSAWMASMATCLGSRHAESGSCRSSPD
jgi:hypothetical protein